MGLDLSKECASGTPVYGYRIDTGNGDKSRAVALFRLLSSQGIYVDWTDKMAAHQMLGNGPVFDWFLANVFHNFYQLPLERRLRILARADFSSDLDHKVGGKIFHPDGRFRVYDLHHRMPSTGETVLEWLVQRYFGTWRYWHYFASMEPYNSSGPTQGLDWSWIQMRLVIRDVVALVEDGELSAVSAQTGQTVLLEGITSSLDAKFLRSAFHDEAYNARKHRMWKHTVIQQTVKAWLEDLATAGKDLEAYGKAEHAAILGHILSHSHPGPREVLLDFKQKKYYRAGCRWSGFTYGPRPKDWSLIWEWDPDVGALVGEFWASIEDPPLAVPGSWVDDEEHDEYD
jgi:hypothetical protein